MSSIADVEDACAEQIEAVDGTPFQRSTLLPVPSFRRSVVPLSAVMGSSLEQHLLFSCVFESVAARDDGESEPEGFVTCLGDLRVQWVTGIRPGAPNDDYRLAGLEAQAIAGKLLGLFTDDFVVQPVLVFRAVQQTNEWLLCEQRHRVLFELSISSS